MALPDGTALSWRSFGRTTSVSWASRVSKKPPVGSTNRARMRVGQPPGGDEPALVERRAVQRQEPFGQEGVVLEDPVRRRPAVLPAPAEQSVGAPETLEEQLGGARGERAIPSRSLAVGPGAGRLEGDDRVGEGRQRKTVPAGQHLVVARRLRARGAPLDQRPTGCREPVGDLGRRRPGRRGQLVVGADPAQDRPALPVARVGHVIGRPEDHRLVRSQLPPDLVCGPDERATFLALGVGVLARGEPALVGPEHRGPGSRASPVATSR